MDSGDALGHDFAPVASLLSTPLGWPVAEWSPLWSRLFRAARAAAELVPSAPANTLPAEVAARLTAAVSLRSVPAAALCLRVMAETAILRDAEPAARSVNGE